MILPRPPDMEAPPMATAAMASISKALPALAAATAMTLEEYSQLVKPHSTPVMVKTETLTRLTFTPSSRAETSLLPMA